jgi:hypothetical protein
VSNVASRKLESMICVKRPGELLAVNEDSIAFCLFCLVAALERLGVKSLPANLVKSGPIGDMAARFG